MGVLVVLVFLVNIFQVFGSCDYEAPNGINRYVFSNYGNRLELLNTYVLSMCTPTQCGGYGDASYNWCIFNNNVFGAVLNYTWIQGPSDNKYYLQSQANDWRNTQEGCPNNIRRGIIQFHHTCVTSPQIEQLDRQLYPLDSVFQPINNCDYSFKIDYPCFDLGSINATVIVSAAGSTLFVNWTSVPECDCLSNTKITLNNGATYEPAYSSKGASYSVNVDSSKIGTLYIFKVVFYKDGSSTNYQHSVEAQIVCNSTENCGRCPNGSDTYPNCPGNTCSRTETCNDHGICNAQGECICDAGYADSPNCGYCENLNFDPNKNCNSCKSPYYGPDCSQSCEDAEFCNKKGTCDWESLSCVCTSPGFSSESKCANCTENLYGPECQTYCLPTLNCSGNGECMHDGSCECTPPYKSANCSIACTPEITCNRAGYCLYDGTCVCDLNYDNADNCKTCLFPFHGANCTEECNCNGKGECDRNYTCNCTGNFDPSTDCSICLPNYFGPNCETKCTIDICNAKGSCNLDGLCDCVKNFNSSLNCSVCNQNFYGPTCETECIKETMCNGNGNCSSTGVCECNSGTYGSDCKLCTCVNGMCNVDGICSCDTGFNGPNCEFDFDECTIKNGGCDPRTSCNNTYGGRTCSDCPFGFYGNGETGCKPYCGNGVCETGFREDCVSCKQDCNTTTCSVCGDNFCESAIGETCVSCPNDCGLCALTCVGDCSGQGKCVQGVCHCNSTWTGPYCNNTKTMIAVTVNASRPLTTINSIFNNNNNNNTSTTGTNGGANTTTSNVAFEIGVQNMQELDENGQIVESVEMNSVAFIFTKSENEFSTIWVYDASLDNGANISITLIQFTKATTYTFADVTTAYSENMIKLNLFISNWPFRSLQNRLSVQMEVEGTGGDKSYETAFDENNNLLYFVVNVNGTAMYAKFLHTSILDSRYRTINFQPSPNKGSVNVILPYFSQIEIDPDFSVLIRTNDERESEEEEPNTPTTTQSSTTQSNSETKKEKDNIDNKIIIIVVCVVVGTAMLAALFIVLVLPRLRTYLQVRRVSSVDLEDVSSI